MRPADNNISLFFPKAQRNDALTVVQPYAWPRNQSLSAALAAMKLEHKITADFVYVKHDGKELFVSTRADAYEKCVLWLVQTGRVYLTGYLAGLLEAYRDYGLSADVDAALASAVSP